MKRLTISKPVSVKWLTRELQAAGVNVASVGQENGNTYAEIAEADETLALTVIQAHDAANNKGTAIASAPVGAKQWLADNPQAKLIWSMSVTDLAAEISNLVEASFGGLSVANRTRWKLLLTAIVLVVRIYVKRELLD